MSSTNEIIFEACFGDEDKTVKLSRPHGAGGDTWHVMIDNYYRGCLFFRNGEWVYFDNWLTMDDVQALGERIDRYLAGNLNQA